MKYIKEYEELYSITSCGRVWSHTNKKFLKTFNVNGYEVVALCKNGKKKNYRVHRLVAEAFVPNPNNLSCVNHKDEIRTHNWINNLEWCDYLYNNNYGNRNEKLSNINLQIIKEKNTKIRCIETGEIFDSQAQAAKAKGVKQPNISKVCNGKLKTTGGYHWEFVKEEI